MDARLLVPGWLMDRFTEDLLARIRDTLLPIAERNGVKERSQPLEHAGGEVDAAGGELRALSEIL